MNSYFELSITDLTFAWGTVTTSQQNKTMIANRTIDFWNNEAAEILFNGSDFTAGGEADEDLEAQNMIVWDEDGVAGGANSAWFRNTPTVGLGTWNAIARQTDDTSQNSYTIHAWFCENGHLTNNVEYDVTLWFQIRADT